MLRLQVNEFGPIHKADVELRPLTVFAGASNTGKSYLSRMIYALAVVGNKLPDEIGKKFMSGADMANPEKSDFRNLKKNCELDERLH